MITVPECYYTRRILNLIDDLIGDGHISYSELEEMDKDRLTVACMDALGEDADIVITESSNLNSLIGDLKKFIMTADMDYGYRLLEKLHANTIDQVSDHMDALFHERQDGQEAITRERMFEEGLMGVACNF